MRPLYNINFLRYFYSAAKNRSMSKAAEENHVTQSAISQGIQKLENNLAKQLVSDRKNLFVLTFEGKLLFEQCEKIFSMFSSIDDLFNEKEGQHSGKLLLATSYSFAISQLPIYYKKLFQLHPSVQPVLRLGHMGLIRKYVHEGEVDLGVVLVNDISPGFDSEEIFSGEYRLYQATKNPKPAIDRLIISEDKREDSMLLDILRKKEGELPPILEVLSWEVIAGMVEQGLGIGLLPDYVAKNHFLTIFPYKMPKMPYRILAIYSKSRKLTRNAEMFINLMKEEASSRERIEQK